MNFKKILISIVVIVLFIFAYEYISTRVYSLNGNRIISIKIANQTFHAEVVSSDQKMQKGLGGRDGICENCGMLFKFQKAGKHSFWMKDMKIPLDIIWLNRGRIVHIEKNVQPTLVGILTPLEDADMVLEINAGIMDKYNLKIGDNIIM